MLERANQRLFVTSLTVSAVFIAGCAAFFSVRGISLLFAGSMLSVAIMATSLEIGKLMAASFVYRQWNRMKILMKFYLCTAVVLLIGLTSLGVYGFLSDAFDKTMTQVDLYETNIVQIDKQNLTYQKEIQKIENAANVVDEKANDSIQQFQKIYDDYVKDQRTRQDNLRGHLKQMDQAVADIENSSGGLFSNKSGKLKALREEQKSSREEINQTLSSIDVAIQQEYSKFLSKVETLRETTDKVPDNVTDVNLIYGKIRDNEQEIQELRSKIRDTDIGSFKFIARSFDMELDDVVKWFILIICLVFDPLAVVMVVGINMMIADRLVLREPGAVKKKVNEPTTTSTVTVTQTPGKDVYRVNWYSDTDIIDTVKVSTTQPTVPSVVTTSYKSAHTSEGTIDEKNDIPVKVSGGVKPLRAENYVAPGTRKRPHNSELKDGLPE